MTPTEYLESRFREYFPTSTFTVDFDDDAAIYVHVETPIPDSDIANHFRLISWTCEIGSDDDRYIFINGSFPTRTLRQWADAIITIPLMPEA